MAQVDPPRSVEAEEALIGAMLLSPDAIEAGLRTVTPADFYIPANAEVFAAIAALHRRGETVDPVTAVEEIVGTSGNRDKAVLLQHAHKVQANTPAIGGAAGYARVVAEKSTLRQLLRAATEIERAVAQGGDAAAVVDEALGWVQGVTAPVGAVESGPDVRTFLAGETEYEWLVPGLIEKRDRLVLTAQEGSGKSHWFRQLAVQVAAGVMPFTESSIIDPCRVLLMDLENSERQVRRKTKPMVTRVPRLATANLVIQCRPRGLNLLARADRRWLMERVAANRPDLLIIGPIYRLHDGNPMDEEPARDVTRVLDDIRDRFGCAVALEAHTAKGSGYGREKRPITPFGASLWLRWPEFGIALVQDDEDTNDYRVVHWRGPRDERSWPRKLRKGERGEWPWVAPVGSFAPDWSEEQF